MPCQLSLFKKQHLIFEMIYSQHCLYLVLLLLSLVPFSQFLHCSSEHLIKLYIIILFLFCWSNYFPHFNFISQSLIWYLVRNFGGMFLVDAILNQNFINNVNKSIIFYVNIPLVLLTMFKCFSQNYALKWKCLFQSVVAILLE